MCGDDDNNNDDNDDDDGVGIALWREMARAKIHLASSGLAATLKPRATAQRLAAACICHHSQLKSFLNNDQSLLHNGLI